jgi:hypothetical protein
MIAKPRVLRDNMSRIARQASGGGKGSSEAIIWQGPRSGLSRHRSFVPADVFHAFFPKRPDPPDSPILNPLFLIPTKSFMFEGLAVRRQLISQDECINPSPFPDADTSFVVSDSN